MTATLMILLLGVYEGVKEGATGYIVASPADAWISQNNSTNLLRSSSLLPSEVAAEIATIGGVRSVGSILRVLTTARVHGETVTLFILGIVPAEEVSYPTTLLDGSASLKGGEVIIDGAFAMKHRLSLGDTLLIQERSYRVTGQTSGTNAIVAQMTFCTLDDAQTMLGFPGLASFFPIRLQDGADAAQVAERIQTRIPGVAAYTKEEFIGNTIRELETGLLPVLWAIALLGMTIGGAVIALLLYGSVVDHREDYALLKALGAGRRTLFGVVFVQALIAAGSGSTIGLLLSAGLSPILTVLVPEVSLDLRLVWIIWVFVACIAMALAGAVAPIRKLATIDPEEVFRS